MSRSDEIKLNAAILKRRYENMLIRWEKQKKRDAFIKKNLNIILSLSTSGWPRLKEMKDRRKWIDIVLEAKIKGIYGLNTANCDVIANLERFAKQIKQES